MNKLLFFGLLFSNFLIANETYTENDLFFEKSSGKYLRVCGEDSGELVIKESCGTFWERFKLKREDIVKKVSQHKELKPNDVVMVKVTKGGTTSWILGKISSVWENGRIDVMEYYSHKFGYSPGTTNWFVDYSKVSKSSAPNEKVLCAKDDFEITYNYDSTRKFKFKKGEKLKVNYIFENKFASVTSSDGILNFLGYGLDNQLPVELNNLTECEKSHLGVNDGSRSGKYSDDGTKTDDVNVDPTSSTNK